MPGQTFGSNKPYLYIIDGVLKQKATENTSGAVRRDYETKDGKKSFKWEISYKSWTGKLKDLRVKESEFGENLEVEFKDAIFTIGVESRYFKDFLQKLPNVNMNRVITVSPYAFESNGKPLKGVTIYQDGEKLKNYYWDEGAGKYCNGFPLPVGDTSQFKKDDWTVYYLGVKKFLLSELDRLKTNLSNDEVGEVDESTQPEPPMDMPEIGEPEEEITVDGEKLPF